MPGNSISATSTSVNPWANSYIPETSKSWEGKPLCINELDKNPNCCASAYDIEAIIDQAYENGIQEHPGVEAINKFPRPCVTSSDLETLADELAGLEPIKTESKYAGAPKSFSLNKDPWDIWHDPDVVNYCKDIVKAVMANNFGQNVTVPYKKALGNSFNKVFDYCARVVVEKVPAKEIFTNQL